MTLIVCVDGGASGCRLAVFADQGEALARVATDAHASLSLGVSAAWSHIELGLQTLRRELNVEEHWQPDVLSMGLAGSLHNDRRQELLELVRPDITALLHTDGYAQLMGATAGEAGICLAVGTGSVMHWQGHDGLSQMAGGWGFPVGDQGSGAWLGMRLLQIYVAHRDGHTHDSVMMDRVEQRIGDCTSSVVEWTTETRSSVIAQLAPLVFAAAKTCDPLACSLIDEAIAHCMTLISLAPDDLPVYIVGGVGIQLRSGLTQVLGDRLRQPCDDALRGLWHLANNHQVRQQEVIT